MKRVFTKLAAGTAVVSTIFLMPLVVSGAEGNVDLPINSAYVWRGQVYNDEAVFQPSVTVSTDYGLSFNTWVNWNLTDRQGDDLKNEICEVDLALSYAKTLGKVDTEIGVTEYVYPNTPGTAEQTADGDIVVHPTPATREAYVSAGLDVLLSPTVKVSYDFDQVNAFYAELGISHSIELFKSITAELSLSMGAAQSDYNQFYFGTDKNALNDGNAKLALTYGISEALTLGGYVQYTRLLDSEIRDAADNADNLFNDGDVVLGGVDLSYSF
jgi:hypothetical protein